MNTKQRLSARVTVNKQGRVVIPSGLRHELNIKPGEMLIARVTDGGLLLEKFESVEKRLRARFASVPPGVSLVDELLAERREAARKEAEEMAEWRKAHPRGLS